MTTTIPTQKFSFQPPPFPRLNFAIPFKYLSDQNKLVASQKLDDVEKSVELHLLSDR